MHLKRRDASLVELRPGSATAPISCEQLRHALHLRQLLLHRRSRSRLCRRHRLQGLERSGAAVALQLRGEGDGLPVATVRAAVHLGLQQRLQESRWYCNMGQERGEDAAFSLEEALGGRVGGGRRRQRRWGPDC